MAWGFCLFFVTATWKENPVKLFYKVLRGAAIVGISTVIGNASVRASVIEAQDIVVNGITFEAFQDNVSGHYWLDLDNFWDPFPYNTFNTLKAFLSGSQFHIASSVEIQNLMASMPAIPANFAADTLIVGGNYFGNPHPGDDRGGITGIYDDGVATAMSLAFKKIDQDVWHNAINSINPTTQFQTFGGGIDGEEYRDLGAWVVSTTFVPTVPIPGALPLLLTGLVGLGFLRRRRTS
ncbi:MAG: hypothetical protein HOB79_13885 [Rhodospirillaceae bacterium]|jgi:hypothetical protein|nr:hypothetical protein [Rhodospirillaceae bacterium]MBT7768488.1 hypothetical protein [Rhodospirillales bacterium]